MKVIHNIEFIFFNPKVLLNPIWVLGVSVTVDQLGLLTYFAPFSL